MAALRDDDSFWETKKDWSERKHLILGYYLTPAAPKLRTVSPDGRVVVLDGFAGRGKYKDGAEGSPVLMGRLADECAGWKSPVALKIYNVEPDKANFRDLAQYTSEWANAGTMLNLPGTFQERLPEILELAGSSPLFAFLDPFRPTHLLFSDFVPLLQRTSTTEVLILFHTASVIRMIRAVHQDVHSNPKTKDTLSRTLDDVFGHRNWRSLLQQGTIDPERVVSHFMDGLAAQSPHGCYTLQHAIEARYGVGLKYHIVFSTRHRDGVKLMNDAFWKESQKVYEQTGRSAQLALFDDGGAPPVEMKSEQRVAAIRATLLDIGMENPARIWSRSDLIFESLRRTFGDFSNTEHLKAVERLIQAPVPPRLLALDGRRAGTGRWITNEKTSMKFEL